MSPENLEDITSLKLKIAVIDERIANWIDASAEYRVNVYGKLESIERKLNGLTCAVHQEKMTVMENRLDSHSSNFKAIWTFISAIILTIIGVFIKGK